ncbi:histidine phosphatase family protein [Limnobacter sp.]|uniref:histidine phosphatase family protein n=1 Tax=Limnobacter sp. TaxID=2003368 RepID=UPI002590F644|nr:histidine phosphatase family protein [Limnobacter sp.]HEX5486951.1 histidine phosphatase family protein [Limnobacter sp.]
MAELYLVRHGQASFGSDNYDQLSPLGHQQAVWLGDYFKQRNLRFDRVVTGTQLRHHQTLEGIAQGMGITVDAQTHPGFNEYDFYGLFAALGDEHASLKASAKGDRRAFYAALKQVLKLWMNKQLTGPLPEHWDDFYKRVQDATTFATRPSARRVLVVSSGGPIGTVTGMALQAPPEMGVELNLQIRNSSLSHFYFNDTTLRLATFNTLGHLDHPDRLHAITYG